MKINKEQLKVAGDVSLRLGKKIVFEGTKAVALQAATKAITTSFDSGFEGVKLMTIDDVIGDKKKKSVTKTSFLEKFKRKGEELDTNSVDEMEVTKTTVEEEV